MKTAVIQMGHCFRTRGATGTTGEQAYVVKVADACKRLLERDGWTVRTILADEGSARYRGDAFVALHCDGSTSASARGASAGYITPEGQALARAWKLAYERRGWSGFRPDNYTDGLRNYYGTRTAVGVGNRRAIIIECGFLTNAEDRAELNAEGGPERVALAIGGALGISGTQPGKDDDMADLNLNQRIGRDSSVEQQFLSHARASGTLGHWLRGQRQFVAGTRDIVTAMSARLTRMELELKAMRTELSDDEAKILAALRAEPGVDPVALATHLAPLLLEGGGMARLSDEDVERLRDATADEIDRRERARANTEV